MDLFIHSSGSLKEKRFVVKSIKDKIRQRFNVSVAEVDHLDKWQLAGIGIAVVASEQKFLDSVMTEISKLIESRGDVEIASRSMEVY
jgi:hypothetical protein